MNRMESPSAAHLVKESQPEEFDLVILGGRVPQVSPSLRDLGTTRAEIPSSQNFSTAPL